VNVGSLIRQLDVCIFSQPAPSLGKSSKRSGRRYAAGRANAASGWYGLTGISV
jgi:hypothetical protein